MTKLTALTGQAVSPLALSDWESFTPTGSWTTNVTYAGYKRRVGDTAFYDVIVLVNGANVQGILRINQPAGELIDSTKLTETNSNHTIQGLVSVFDATGISRTFGRVATDGANQVMILISDASTAYAYGNTVDSSANRPITFATGDRIYISWSVPIVGWTSNYSVIGVSSAGGLAPVALATSTTAVTNTMYLADVTAGPITLTLPGGTTAATVGVLDAQENFSSTNYVDIAPASGQSISGYAVNDILQLRTPRSQLVLYRATGSTNWKLQTQAVTTTPIATATTQGTVAGGLVPAKLPTSVTDVIGPSYVGQFIDLSSTSVVNYGNTTALNNLWAEVNGITLLPGVYEVVAHVLWNRNGATFSSISDVLVGFAVPAGGVDPYTQNGWWQGTNATGISNTSSTFGQSLSVIAVSDGTSISINGRTSTAGASIRLKTFLGTYTAGQPVFKYLFYAKRLG